MKGDDFEICSLVLRTTTNFREPHVRVHKILNHPLIKEYWKSQDIQHLSKKLYKALDLLKDYGLIEITKYHENGHPDEFKLTPKGDDVKNSKDELMKFVAEINEQKVRSKKIEEARYSKDKSDILRNRVWFFIAIPGALYTIADVACRIIFPGSGILDFVINLVK